jgi:SagB-type dehydrogenase family enzyme
VYEYITHVTIGEFSHEFQGDLILRQHRYEIFFARYAHGHRVLYLWKTKKPLAMQPTGRIFMEKTRYDCLSRADQFQGRPAPPLEKPVPKDGKFISLPQPVEISVPLIELRSAIESRRSIRRYSSDPLTLKELAYLFWCTQGIVQRHEPYATFRNVPSAGGRHAFETYLQVNRVRDLEPGLYRYLAFSQRLMDIEISPGTADRLMEACLRQALVKKSAVTFIWSCVIYRMAWRYSERAYRLVHLDAGHVCQNLYLAAEQLNCGVCAIGAFDDELMAGLLGIDGLEEFVIYCATVGKK